MAWSIDCTESARRELSRIDRRQARRILDFMDLGIAPEVGPPSQAQPLSGPIVGAYWRYRVGDHRIICDLGDKVRRILVIEIGHRPQI